MMPWWIQLIVGGFVTTGIGFWGWLACKVIDQGRKIAELEARMQVREGECAARTIWLRKVEEKIDNAIMMIGCVAVDVGTIKGALNPNGTVARKRGD